MSVNTHNYSNIWRHTENLCVLGNAANRLILMLGCNENPMMMTICDAQYETPAIFSLTLSTI